jgi:hypothetical protein
MARNSVLPCLLAGMLLVACGEATPLAPPDVGTPQGDALLSVQSAATNGGYGARVLREHQLCFLPAVAPDGSVYPLEDWPCEVQLVLTRNRDEVANGWIRATVPNESGRAVRMTFGNPEPIPCWIEFDTDGDGNPDVLRLTTKYTMTISATGRLHLSCHFRDT